MADFEIVLPFYSRFKETRLLQAAGRVYFGLWRPPSIRLDGDEPEVQVTEKDRGTLDFIADRELGNRELAWALAVINKISYIPEEVVPGMILKIPKLVRVEEALQKETDGE